MRTFSTSELRFSLKDGSEDPCGFLDGFEEARLSVAQAVVIFRILDEDESGYLELAELGRPVQPQPRSIPSASQVCAARTLKPHRSIPGHSIAAVRALKSRLSATAGGKGGLTSALKRFLQTALDVGHARGRGYGNGRGGRQPQRTPEVRKGTAPAPAPASGQQPTVWRETPALAAPVLATAQR